MGGTIGKISTSGGGRKSGPEAVRTVSLGSGQMTSAARALAEDPGLAGIEFSPNNGYSGDSSQKSVGSLSRRWKRNRIPASSEKAGSTKSTRRSRMAWRKRTASQASTADTSASVDPDLSASERTATDAKTREAAVSEELELPPPPVLDERGLPVFDLEKCTREELLGGEDPLLDSTVEWEGVQGLLAALSPTELTEVTDPRMFIRHFRAEKGDQDKALASLKAALAWRRSYGVNRVRRAMHDFRNSQDPEYRDMMYLENETGKLYVRGFTKEGRALLYMNAMKNNTPHAEEDNMKHLVWNIEKCVSVTHYHSQGRAKSGAADDGCTVRQPLDKYCLMIDCANYQMAKSPSMSASKFTLDVLQKHYPERMHRAYVLNPPMAFRIFWNLIKAFVDPVTKSKIVFVHANSPGLHQMRAELGSHQASKLEPCAHGPNGTKAVRPFSSKEYLELPPHAAFDE